MHASNASRVHEELLTAVEDLARAEHRAVSLFADVMRRHLYRDLEYGSIYDYAKRALGFSKSKTAQFVRLAKALKDHPELSREMKRGALGWTNAREILPVLDKKNDRAWIDLAKATPRRQLAREVRQARAKPQDVDQQVLAAYPEHSAPPELPAAPVTVSFQLDSEQYARYEALVEAVRKRGVREERAELLLAALEALRAPATANANADADADADAYGGPPTPIAPPYRIVTYMCRTCGRAHTPTIRGDRAVSVVELARQLSDGEIVEEGKRRRRSISPAMRARVMARDGHRCQTEGCLCTRFLEVHHRTPLSKGGTNEDDNLVTLCSRCHRAAHEREHRAELHPGAPTESAPSSGAGSNSERHVRPDPLLGERVIVGSEQRRRE